MSELSKRYEEISKKLYAIVEEEIGGASYLAEKFEAVLRDSLPTLNKEWEREAERRGIEMAAQLIEGDAWIKYDMTSIAGIAHAIRALARED